MILTELLTEGIKAALEAGENILRVYNSGFSIDLKEDRSPLTTADTLSHALITRRLKGAGLPILSEEGKNIPYEERKDWTLFWLVDPLDGTKEFIRKNGEFTVNIALIRGHTPVAGVIYLPVKDILYYGVSGAGSFKVVESMKIREKELTWDNLSLLSQKLPIPGERKNFVVVASRSHMNEETARFIGSLDQIYGSTEMVSAGSSLKLCLVAEGSADIYPRFGPTFEWDTAAGQAIVEQSGGKVTLTNGKDPLTYNKENLLNPHFIVRRQVIISRKV